MNYVSGMRPFVIALAIAVAPSLHAATYNVRDSGAKADKITNDAAAFQAAIDACNKGGGGEVLVPAGNYFCGKIVMKSNVTLKLENGATIFASGKIEDYNSTPGASEISRLFVADGQENLGIVGDGIIIGTGQGELRRREGDDKPLPAYRFGIVHLHNCKNAHLRDFKILFSDYHTITFTECEDIFVSGLSIINSYWHTETDGIDPISSKNVFISNCHISGGDDCISPKTRQGNPLENLVVDNCILESISTAIKFGTGSAGDFRDIKVSNCVIRNTTIGIGLFIKDGGLVERLSFSNISIETPPQDEPINAGLRHCIMPIYVDIGKRTTTSPVSRIRDLSFSDIQIASDSSVVVEGEPWSEIENVTLRNISFRVTKGFDFSARKRSNGGGGEYRDENEIRFARQPSYFAMGHIHGLTLDNVRVLIDKDIFKQFDRSAAAIFDSQNVVVRNVQREPAAVSGGQPVVSLNNCTDVSTDEVKK